MIFNQKIQTQHIIYKVVSFAFLLFFLNQLWGFYHDDAYIVLRYAQNFITGNGLVWNIDERVEGYSTFLWVILISLLGFCRIDLVLASRILGIMFALATILLFFISGKDKYPWGALFLSTNSCFVLWALGGLETTVFGFFILLGCLLFLRKDKTVKASLITGIIFSLAAMTRPEGLLFFGITGLFFFYDDKGVISENIKNTAFYVAGFLFLYLPYFVWRYSYYGYLFPCTFYVKGGTNIFKLLFGGRYVFHFLFSYGFPLFILLFIKNKKNFFKQNLYLTTLFCVFGAYVLSVGGDHMPGFRFFTPILPLFYLFINIAFNEVSFRQNRRVHMLVLIIIVSINFFVSFTSIPRGINQNREAMKHSYKYRNCFKIPDHAAYVGKHVGLYIKDKWPAKATIALNVVGAIPYFSGLRSIDMLGLNDYTIARREISYDYSLFPHKVSELTSLFTACGRKELFHKLMQQYLPWQLIPGHGKGDGQYVLSRKPDFIIVGFAQGSDKPSFLGDKEILSSPDFLRNYILKKVRIKITDQLYPYFFVNNSPFFDFTYYERKN